MADTLIPGLSDPSSVIIFDTFRDIVDLVAPEIDGLRRFNPNMIAVSTRRRASNVAMGQLMQACGESVEQGGALDPSDL